jgi:hypothetical protein
MIVARSFVSKSSPHDCQLLTASHPLLRLKNLTRTGILCASRAKQSRAASSATPLIS